MHPSLLRRPGRLGPLGSGTAESRSDLLGRLWRVTLPDRVEGGAGLLVARASRARGVVCAYLETGADDTGRVTSPDRRDPGRVADAAPHGIGARWAWRQAGGRGAGIGLVDVEQGWFLAHEALRGRFGSRPLWGENRFERSADMSHGTEVLGVIAGSGPGVIGLAPDLSRAAVSSHYDGSGTPRVAEAVLAAMAYLHPGDVLLVEVQRCGMPAETDLADYLAISSAVDSGIVVIEAAGNGGRDLDDWRCPTGRRMRHGVGDGDSGAVVVGAARRRVEGTGSERGHRWLLGSNYGRRVDCFGWGEGVHTSTARGPAYRPDFGGTSAAAAVVAGAAVLAQSLHLGAHGSVLTPSQVRDLLSAPFNTPQFPREQQERVPIGVMPDLRRIGAAIGVGPTGQPATAMVLPRAGRGS